MNRLNGKVAVVTGAAQGIGAAYAEGLASEGAKVVVADLADTSAVVNAINEAGGSAIGCQTDVTDNQSLAAMLEVTESAFGPVEILINNAAIFASLTLKPFTEIDEEEWDAVMRVNVRGPFQCAKTLVPSMRRNGRGKIINIASGTFLRGAPMFCHYVSSKGAIVGQTRALAAEVGADNIHVNCILVGLTESEGVKEHKQLAAIKAPTLANRVLKRAMVPEDLLGTMYFLASEDSDFITGQCVNVDGGALNY
ncbi:SDR family oxidoreductase [Pseudomaricurvus alkylphenolicus]|jgi:NAD(P)-dependent dehydrogenase (short-subunit alcohol dehydrogenase family)|uniref:SDR family NAD(P)-dependent oxidoreductase n=1 Tax=Pseudomaricurvus alkylphenolicus TaxID=1306991 RepID=UPI0014240461|nr:SDR family oxidoreductase [Pseudomaricurvus alkylphenolicus]NIB38524.1 SDR family oxidoreductase [Pseudomaricurvus alkylphenolicus]